MLAAPTYIILLTTQHEPDLTTADKFFTSVQLLLVVSEWFSDQQQWGKLACPPLFRYWVNDFRLPIGETRI